MGMKRTINALYTIETDKDGVARVTSAVTGALLGFVTEEDVDDRGRLPIEAVEEARRLLLSQTD